MTYKTDADVMSRVREHLEAALAAYPCDWFVIVAQGSWNYGMADEESDVDTKMLTIPSLETLVLNKKPLNTVHIMENNEHCDMKDVREYFKIFRKSNINFVEILFSDYWIVNPKYMDLWFEMRARAEELARMNPYAAVSCMAGMCEQKYAALSHPYPSKLEILSKYGYDPKQLHHIIRVSTFMTEYIENEKTYKEILSPDNKDYLLKIKRGFYNKDEAERLANIYMKEVRELKAYIKDNWKNEEKEECNYFLDSILYQLIIRSLKNALNND